VEDPAYYDVDVDGLLVAGAFHEAIDILEKVALANINATATQRIVCLYLGLTYYFLG